MRIADWKLNLGCFVCGAMVLGAMAEGCVTKAKAKADARAAYLAGRQEALARLPQVMGPNVNIIGPVKNAWIPWTEGLTLAKAIVDSGYEGTREPASIIIVRQGQGMRVDPKLLLQGRDVPIEAGEMIKIEP